MQHKSYHCTSRFLAVFSMFSIITACSTVVDLPAPVSSEFEQRAELVRLKEPSFNFDAKYNKTLFDFQVIDTDTSWVSSDSSIEYVPGEKPNFFEWLLFDDHVLSTIQQHRINKFQEFRFNLKSPSGTIARTNCQISALEFAAVKGEAERHVSPISSGRRFETFLACQISQFGDITQFSVYNTEEGWELKINKSTKPLTFSSVVRDTMLVKHRNGLTEERMIPPWAKTLDGIAIYHHDRQEAQISWDQNYSSIWLGKHTAPEIRELMAAMAYSIVMFDWLDDEWKE